MEWQRATKLEVAKDMFRQRRELLYKAFDVWEKAVIRGREQDSQEVMNWYQEMLDFTDLITEETTFSDYPQLPDELKKYLIRC